MFQGCAFTVDGMQNIPDSVSFRQLATLLSDAPSGSPVSDSDVLNEQVALDWSQRVETLLKEVEQSSDQASAGKNNQQVMALGSCRTHLWLGLQALKASGL